MTENTEPYMPDCMVDIETSGLESGRNAMIQLSAVKFDLKTGAIGTNHFNRCLAIPPHRYWSEDTWNWWMDTNEDYLRTIYTKMEDPAQVMADFVKWVEPNATFWSKPLSFDFPFVSSYCRDFGLAMPFDFRVANDMRSFMRGMSAQHGEVFKEPKLEFMGTAHNSVYDAIHQIRILFEHKKNLEGGDA